MTNQSSKTKSVWTELPRLIRFCYLLIFREGSKQRSKTKSVWTELPRQVAKKSENYPSFF
jgi:hypothetical protein